jgi:hypothetical protein
MEVDQQNQGTEAGNGAPGTSTQEQGSKPEVKVDATTPAGKFVQMPTHQVGKIKREAGQAANKKLAQELGFADVESMKAAAAKMKAASRAPSAPVAKPKVQPGASVPQRESRPSSSDSSVDYAAILRERDDLRAKNERLAREKARVERAAREAKREALANAAEGELRSIAASEGIVDLDYAIHLIRQHTNGMDEAKLRAFDERGYFRGLKAKHPYLFGQVQQPATTGLPENPSQANKPGSSVQITSGAVNATPPAPSAQPSNGRTDVSRLKPEEFKAYLRSKGVGVN